MTREQFEHDMEFSVFAQRGTTVPLFEGLGEIEIQIKFTVTSWGVPARINYNEHDHPAESAEIEVDAVLMKLAYGTYVPAWDWLADEIGTWVDSNVDELATDAGNEVHGRIEAAAEAEGDELRERIVAARDQVFARDKALAARDKAKE